LKPAERRVAKREEMTMNKKKQRQYSLNQATRKTVSFLSVPDIVDRLKEVIITASIWGWLPLSLGKWILNKEKVMETSKHSKRIV
jgi:hypothetical protein